MKAVIFELWPVFSPLLQFSLFALVLSLLLKLFSWLSNRPYFNRSVQPVSTHEQEEHEDFDFVVYPSPPAPRTRKRFKIRRSL